MDKLDNIEVFGLCVAEIMVDLYTAFPIPTSLPASRVVASYGPAEDECKARIVHPSENDYMELFPKSFDLDAGILEVTWEANPEYYFAKAGQPIQYWTHEQVRAIKANRARVREAEKIYDETVLFLVREGYIANLQLPNEKNQALVLTSKGFAHLNKKFERGTIKDEFTERTVKTVFNTVKSGADVVSAAEKIATSDTAKGLVRIVALFFGGSA